MISIISDADFRAMEQVAKQNAGDSKHLNRIMRTAKIVRHPKLLKKGSTIKFSRIVMALLFKEDHQIPCGTAKKRRP